MFLLPNIVACIAHGNQQPINCALPHEDRRLNQCSVVRYASEFNDCLSNAQIDQHTCVVMDSDLEFCSNEVSVPITAIFDRSEKTLDCANGAIDHGWGRISLPGGPATTDITRIPAVRFYDDRSLADITVRNCTIRGTNHIGIQATRFFGGELGEDGKLDPDEPLPVGHNSLRFEDLIIEDTGLGIYLGTYSQDVDIQRVRIDNSERIAIYSEAGTHRLHIQNAVISNNKTREAVAIDSTYDSEISNSLFINNREGAINLYQNCGELKGIVCPVVRSTPSNNNRIVGNTFINNGVAGVQIASRQGRNHALGWCESLNGLPGKFTDTAKNNVVSDNTFVCDRGTSIAVMNGPNDISNNTIVARRLCVPYEISTGGFNRSSQSLLDGIVVRDNVIDSVRPPRLRNISDAVTIDNP